MVKTYCFLKQITRDEEILKIAKMAVDFTINIPENITPFNELVSSLKQDISPLTNHTEGNH